MNIVNGPQSSANHQDVRVVVTSAPTLPNVIPVNNAGKVQSQAVTPIIQVPSQRPLPYEVTMGPPKVTAQQILHQQMLNKKKALELEKMRASTKRPFHSGEKNVLQNCHFQKN